MQGRLLLHKVIEESCVGMHKKTKNSLLINCEGLLISHKLSVTMIGRAAKSKAAPKHRIKSADRLVSNQILAEYKDGIYKTLAENILPHDLISPILVDVCCLSPDAKRQVLRGSLAAGGRALTIYEIVYKNGKGKLTEVMEKFLKKLKIILPLSAKVIIVTDAGFHNRWFHLVSAQGWDFIGRVRQNKPFVTMDGEKKYCNSLHSTAKLMPQYQGEVKLCEKSMMRCHLYTVKKKIKGKKKKNKKGTFDKCSYSKEHAKSHREPWVLATSLPSEQYNAKKIVALYSLRMQIEESFRDMKNHRYGFSFKHTLTQDINRLNNLLLIAAIVTFIAWLAGKVAEMKNWHRSYQSNTTKRRTLSHFYLGMMILSSNDFQVNSSDIKIILCELKDTHQIALGRATL